MPSMIIYGTIWYYMKSLIIHGNTCQNMIIMVSYVSIQYFGSQRYLKDKTWGKRKILELHDNIVYKVPITVIYDNTWD